MNNGFTLIIPLYNKQNTIKLTLDSVLNNHGEYPFKCIIVDDDSTDGSSEIAEEYDMKYPDVFMYIKKKHHGNKTPSFARNLGIKLTESKYIGFLDADDELCPGFIDKGCNFLDEHPEFTSYNAAYTIRFKDEEGNVNETVRKYDNENLRTFLEYIMSNGPSMHFCAGIYRTELIKDCLFSNSFCEDTVFQLKYIYKHEPIYVDNTVTNSIIYNTQYSDSKEWNKQRTNSKWNLEIYETLSKEIPDIIYGFNLDENNKLWCWYK